MQWLEKDLKTVDSTTPIVVSVHIPLVSVFARYYGGATKAHHNREIVTNAREVISLFSDHKLKLVLQGHLHQLQSVWIEGTTYLTSGAVSGKWWLGPHKNTREGFLMITADRHSAEFSWKYIEYGWEAANSK